MPLFWSAILSTFRKASHERGATMVEYALMVALIAIVSYLVVQTLGNETSEAYKTLADNWPATN